MLKAATAKELPTEQALFIDAWNMLKDFYYIEPSNNIDEWGQVLERARGLYSKGKGNPAQELLAHSITNAVVTYLETTSRSRV